MAKATIEVDVYNSLDIDGLYSAVYFGESDDDPIEVRTPWDEVIASEIEMHTVPLGGPYVVSESNDSVRDAYEIINMLHSVADRIEASISERGILLRDKFYEATGGELDMSRRDEFIVTYEEYINYLMETKDD